MWGWEPSDYPFFITFGAIAIGLVASLIYTLQRKVLTVLQWMIAFLAALGWGLGWYIGYLPFYEKWGSFYYNVEQSNPTVDLISDIHLSGYYSLAIGGILAALLGVGALYLLLRYFPAQGKR